ncbi:hypothetical protein K443DRAFT_551659 [Laccaria amethystina LaAM-08-1]|uniref:Uncharacterized protein n=1 Tax=Laccaria amethystina LaAM-08-1 TaxID=1095629 RepID=A0A0C9WY93_9AGAR|nr:hypothetical protein K443DRAFT_578551 [Laccaria amethystina LaAM-08-1]KIJ90356.1 hypothetical protein K443DRAFT_551659 [Laccaria amethystina LaAM-08-1]
MNHYAISPCYLLAFTPEGTTCVLSFNKRTLEIQVVDARNTILGAKHPDTVMATANLLRTDLKFMILRKSKFSGLHTGRLHSHFRLASFASRRGVGCERTAFSWLPVMIGAPRTSSSLHA